MMKEISSQFFTALHHVQLTVPVGAMGEAKLFYCSILNFREVRKPENLHHVPGLWLQLEEVQIHIAEEECDYRSQTRAHVAFLVNDLQEVREALQAKEVSISENVPIPGFERFDFRDPFGNRIEVMKMLP